MSIPAGAAAPEAYRLRLRRKPSSTLDLSTVTAADVVVECPNGKSVVWATDIVSQSTTEIVLRHVFAVDATDVAQPGHYRQRPRLTFPDGVRRARCQDLIVQ